jgi:hypothetical protein
LSETLRAALRSQGVLVQEGGSVTEEGRTGPDREGSDVDVRGVDLEDLETAVGHTSRLERRLEALERRQRQPEPRTPLKLLTTDELQQVLTLTERGGVLPNGEVRYPEAFREATLREREALEHWRKLCGEPLDHLELAEELLDRMGEAHGWRSHEAVKAAVLLKRLELPEESSWFVGKMAEAVLNFYAELEEHPEEPQHPKVRGAVRRLERLKEIDRLAPDEHRPPSGATSASEALKAPQEPAGAWDDAAQEAETGADTRPGGGGAQEVRERPVTEPVREEEPERVPWWRRLFGG